jgi:hypothetical protein
MVWKFQLHIIKLQHNQHAIIIFKLIRNQNTVFCPKIFCCFADLLRSVKNIKGTCRFTPYRKLYQHNHKLIKNHIISEIISLSIKDHNPILKCQLHPKLQDLFEYHFWSFPSPTSFLIKIAYHEKLTIL